MAIYATMLLCGLGLAILVYRYDMYEKEPWYLLLAAMGLGMASGWLIGFAEDAAIVFFGDAGSSVAGQAMIAAVMEEAAKLLVVVLIAVVFSREFNDPLDGIVYGAFVGLGAAIEESLFYLGESSLKSQLLGTEAVRLLLHLLLGGLGGFGLGFARLRLRRWPGILLAWFAAAVTIHFLWDFLCGLPARTGAEAGFVARAAAVGLTLTGTLLFGISVVIGARHSRRMHAPGSRRRLWGWPLTIWFRRRD